MFVSRLGYQLESLGYFRRAVSADGTFLKAQENLDNACSSMMERWHFRMLNDAVRNTAFNTAISHALNSLIDTSDGLVVLDIGTGSGILRHEIDHVSNTLHTLCHSGNSSLQTTGVQPVLLLALHQDVYKQNNW